MNPNSKTIQCRAAICFAPNQPLFVKTIEVDPPKDNEVRVKIFANSICHSDINCCTGVYSFIKYPIIPGHEAAGIVESVGKNVSSVVVGDNVLLLVMSYCGLCLLCKNAKTNFCIKQRLVHTTMTDKTTRFKFNGQPVYHLFGISSLSEYTVVDEAQVIKIDQKARLDRVCLMACGFPTGYGAVVKVAKVEPLSMVGVWGLGAVGLAAIYGASKCGASIIIGVDIKEEKKEIAFKFGCTHFLNPTNSETTIKEAIKSITNGFGLDYALECVGSANVVEEAIECTSAYGSIVVVGSTRRDDSFSISPNVFLSGKKLTGALVGGYKSKLEIPNLVAEYVEGKIDIEPFFTGNVDLIRINEAFEELKNGNALRTVIKM